MEEAKSANLTCNQEDYSKIPKTSEIDQIEEYVRKKTLDDGFLVIKPTATKHKTLYFICKRSGKPRESKSVGKRAKPSLKIGLYSRTQLCNFV